MPYECNYKASCARPGYGAVCNFWHPGALTLRAKRQSARCSKITINTVWHSMHYSCTHMATVGVKGLTVLAFKPSNNQRKDVWSRWTTRSAACDLKTWVTEWRTVKSNGVLEFRTSFRMRWQQWGSQATQQKSLLRENFLLEKNYAFNYFKNRYFKCLFYLCKYLSVCLSFEYS